MSESPMRVLQFIEGGARYGAAVSVMNVAAALRESGIEVEFAIFKDKPLGDVLIQQGFQVHEIPARKKFDLKGLRYLVRFLKTGRFDVLHTHLSKATILGSIAGRLARVPVVATVHGMNQKYTYLLASYVMTVSEAAKRHLVQQGMSPSRVTAVYNGIALEPFFSKPSRTAAKASFGLSSESVVIGTVSRAHKQKGVELAIEAVAELRRRGHDAKYLFVGDGPHIEDFRAQVQILGLTDHSVFPGFSESIVPALAAMDVFMFPTYREAFGISLLEAMAAEVPIVASSVDGVPEVLGTDSGILLDEPTAIALADAAESLICQSSMRDQIVKCARERVETVFSLTAVAQSIEAVYQLAISESQARPKRRYSGAL